MHKTNTHMGGGINDLETNEISNVYVSPFYVQYKQTPLVGHRKCKWSDTIPMVHSNFSYPYNQTPFLNKIRTSN